MARSLLNTRRGEEGQGVSLPEARVQTPKARVQTRRAASAHLELALERGAEADQANSLSTTPPTMAQTMRASGTPLTELQGGMPRKGRPQLPRREPREQELKALVLLLANSVRHGLSMPTLLAAPITPTAIGRTAFGTEVLSGRR